MSNAANATEHSKILAAWRRIVRAGGEWLRSSRAARWYRRVSRRTEAAAAHSAIHGVGATVARWIRASWLYRWLTKEPDPDVIVIDLRETWTVGPIIALLDRLAAPVGSAWQGSGADDALAAIAAEPVRALGIVTAVAVAVNLLVAAALGDLTQAGLGARLVVFGLGLLATRERRSPDELAETWVGRALVALLVPPEPPENEAESVRTNDDDR